MHVFKWLSILLILLGISFSSQALDSQPEKVGNSDPLILDGKSFQGRIRATGIMGLFSAKGTLLFKDGLLIWSVKGTEESAPYQVKKLDDLLVFSARLPSESDTYVDWSGIYDGENITEVKAVWNRTEEEDFIHDLLLPDIVTLKFKPLKD